MTKNFHNHDEHTVLVAEDSVFFRKQVVKSLHEKGYLVQEAEDGQQALDIIEACPDVNILIADWNMPRCNGPELCKTLKKLRPERFIYSLLLTSQNDIESLIEGMEAGADDYITKSNSFDELHARLRAAIRIVGLHASLRKEKEHLFKVNQNLTQITKKLQNKERELQHALSLHSEVVTAIPSFCISLREDFTIKTWNRAAAELFQKSSSFVAGKSILALELEWEEDKVKEALYWCLNYHKPLDLQNIAFKKAIDGQMRNLDITITTILNKSDSCEGFLLTGTDVTHSRKLEYQLAQRSKLESIGQLAAGVAHEINTPIQYVRDNTSFIFEELRNAFALYSAYEECIKEPEQIEYIQKVKQLIDFDYILQEIPAALTQTLDGVNCVAEIVRSMKEFAHPGSQEKEYACMNRGIQSIVSVARNEWKHVSEMELRLDRNLPEILCHRAEIHQVILNLIINAAQAIQSTGQHDGLIRIETESRGETIRISVIDNGGGIPVELQGKIFDPFFTTKDVGVGTGQGLSLAYSTIVERHGGQIEFSSLPGQGSHFSIILPRADMEERDSFQDESMHARV